MTDARAELQRRLRGVRLLAVDVDGVLTDGSLYFHESGDEIKSFHVQDGLGLQLLMQAGVEVAVVSGRESGALARRVSELGVRHFFAGVSDKVRVLSDLVRTLDLSMESVAFVGDDLPDRPALDRVGVPISVADAHPSARAAACWVTRASGGRGAVREVADAILASREGGSDAGRASTDATLAREFHVVIPARYAAERLPGKPLRQLGDRPLIAHVWARGVESGAREVLVATDDERIAEAVRACGGRALLSTQAHATGSDRVAEAMDRARLPDSSVVVNLQGDEPFVAGELIAGLAASLHAHPDAGMATLATPIQSPQELFDPNVVKLVLDQRQNAQWFSRAPIPWVRGLFGGAPLDVLPPGVPFLRHLGIYAYRAGALRRIRDEKPAALESAEQLEQLRALFLGISIHVEIVPSSPERGIDTPEDLARAERYLSQLQRER